MNSDRLPRHLAAILYADVVGFSRMSEADEEGTFLKVRDYLDNFAQLIRNHNGEVIKYAGDAVLAIFNSATDALICAAQVQASTAELNQNLSDDDKVRFRIGLNLGDIIKDRGDVFGDGVNVAARLEALAKPEGICVSGSFYDAIAMKLPFDFDFMGDQQVKNISKPIRAYHAQLQDDAALPGANSRPGPHHKSNPNHLKLGILSVIFVVIIVSVVMFFQEKTPSTEIADKRAPAMTEPAVTQAARQPVILILPFKNLSGNEDQEYFADGITEDLIIDLSRLSNLQVLARNTSFKYKSLAVDPVKLKNDLSVSHFLEGSIRRAGDQIRITSQLTDIDKGTPIWAERYDRKLDDIFAVQDDVVKNIISALSIHLTASEETALSKTKAGNVEAYDLFLQGQWLVNIRTRQDNALAQQYYRDSIQKDPNYSRPYGALAVAITHAVNAGWSDTPTLDRDRALELARKAISLDNTSPHAYWALGFTHLFRKEYQQAEDVITEAVHIAPNYADGYGLLALIKNHVWKAEEAIEYTEKAMKLNPLYTYEYLYNLGVGYYTLEQYDKAIDYLEEALERNPNFSRARMFLSASYTGSGMDDEAEWETQQVLIQRPQVTTTKIKEESGYTDHPVRDRFVAQLRQSGIPEK